MKLAWPLLTILGLCLMGFLTGDVNLWAPLAAAAAALWPLLYYFAYLPYLRKYHPARAYRIEVRIAKRYVDHQNLLAEIDRDFAARDAYRRELAAEKDQS